MRLHCELLSRLSRTALANGASILIGLPLFFGAVSASAQTDRHALNAEERLRLRMELRSQGVEPTDHAASGRRGAGSATSAQGGGRTRLTPEERRALRQLVRDQGSRGWGAPRK